MFLPIPSVLLDPFLTHLFAFGLLNPSCRNNQSTHLSISYPAIPGSMPQKKGNEGNEVEEEESYYVSVRDLSFDLLRQRASATNLGVAERRQARRELLLKMGAKPPKGTAVNYRLLMETRKRERQNALTDYKNERFKKTTLERQLGRHAKNKRRRRKALRHSKGLPNLERGAWIATDVLPVVEADRCAGSIEDRAKDKTAASRYPISTLLELSSSCANSIPFLPCVYNGPTLWHVCLLIVRRVQSSLPPEDPDKKETFP
ncbi:hypothetical protein EGR_05135 [Echinococcus granulosus]|uniref:Uncharacterized protein n=1 Tax=Echinococcus granulosus TaxID=6210 RepID=W6V276_ECHGR|nr:hypothetical protein EGR_05135 [Echinococcus granulosus]EUB59974.1 hypothetical protein EGR_05135 [Echinococcus granulosus]